MVDVRRLEPGDYAAWEELFRAYHTFYETTIPDRIYPIAWERLLSNDAHTHVGFAAIVESRMVGFAHALLHRSTWVETGHVYLQDLFVTPAVRGSGAGRALIEAVYDYADTIGAERTYWLTHESNLQARALYDKIATASGFIQYRR